MISKSMQKRYDAMGIKKDVTEIISNHNASKEVMEQKGQMVVAGQIVTAKDYSGPPSGPKPMPPEPIEYMDINKRKKA